MDSARTQQGSVGGGMGRYIATTSHHHTRVRWTYGDGDKELPNLFKYQARMKTAGQSEAA